MAECFRRPLPLPMVHCKFQHDQTICLDPQIDFGSLDIQLTILTILASFLGFSPLGRLVHCHPYSSNPCGILLHASRGYIYNKELFIIIKDDSKYIQGMR